MELKLNIETVSCVFIFVENGLFCSVSQLLNIFARPALVIIDNYYKKFKLLLILLFLQVFWLDSYLSTRIILK
jgi:hypothetical protein